MIPSLSSLIIETTPIKDLYEIYDTYKFLSIEIEVGRRLNLDIINVNIINFLYKKMLDKTEDVVKNYWLKSVHIIKSLKFLIDNVPWRIGVIYNYMDHSYQINNIMILLGYKEKYITNKGNFFKANWSYSEDTKLTLREVISLDSRPFNNNISVVTHDHDLDKAIRDSLLINDIAKITICIYISKYGSFKSYPEYVPLSHAERKQIYPCHIVSGNFSHNLVITDIKNTEKFHVEITKSPEIYKLLSLIKN